MRFLLDRLVLPVAIIVAALGLIWVFALGAPEAKPGRLGERAVLRRPSGVLSHAATPAPSRKAGAAARSSNRAATPVNWRRRYLAEHEHVQRLLHLVHASRARVVQAHAGTDWRAKQIAAAEVIGHEATSDPWPNCPDPIWDGAASWDVTVQCENGGSWLDSPGYYRCGLQFDPMWERRFGLLCPR